MDNKIAQKLNQINMEFYKIQASSFSDTRAISWSGWDNLEKFIKQIKNNMHIKVCDMGCGNGRFIDYLDSININYEYLGVDFSDELIQIAKSKYKNRSNVKFLSQDFLNDFPDSGAFDLVVCFGVMHHIFDYNSRLAFIKNLMQQLDQDGLLVITFWQFMKSSRFERLVIAQEKVGELLQEDATKLQKHDYLLDWDKSGFPRYCHHFSDDEIEQIKKDLSTSGLELITEYNADGKEENLNKYLIFRK